MTSPSHESQAKTSSGVRTQLLSEPQESLTSDTVLSHLMHIEAKDVTLKFLFDHVRNYVICIALLIAGYKAFKLKTIAALTIPQVLGSGTLIVIAITLLILNFFHGITALSRVRNVTTISKVGYFIATALILLSIGALAVASAA